MIVGIDVGGTFTDVVAVDGDDIVAAKIPTTPDQSVGVEEGVQRVGSHGPVRLVHGTTVATNALLERTGARTALITDRGLEDIIEIGRQDRPSLYDPTVDRPEPLVAREDRFGRHADGTFTELPPGIESVAVSLLRSYEDPAAERDVRDRIRSTRPGVPVSLSSDVSPEFREYERTSTTVLNAYLTSVTARYLERIGRRLDARVEHITVMRSSGGLATAGEAAALPASILLSGPAGGAAAAGTFGTLLGLDTVVSFDMGGTSTDVCRIVDGRPEVTYQRSVAGYPCRMPSTAIHTVGAGGGSIAWVDAGGSLRVGPSSAGSVPGPAAYARGGTRPTVTDANIVLGRISPDARLGGELAIRGQLALAAVADLGERLGLDPFRTALGIVAIVEEHMAAAIRTVSIDRGADPRDAALVAFGGAGALHATALARTLGMRAVIVPPFAGVFSALGLLLSPPRTDVSRTILVAEGDVGVLDDVAAELGREAEHRLRAMGDEADRVTTMVDVRYRGQSHELTVPYHAGEGWAVLGERFHHAHRRRNGFRRPGDPIEAVTVRAEAIGVPAIDAASLPPHRPVGEPSRGTRPVVTDDGIVDATVWWRPALAPDAVVPGPAVVEEPEATTWVAAGETARIDPLGAMEIRW